MSNSSASPIFNKDLALERMAFDAQLFREMIDLILEDGPRRMRELLAGLTAGDLSRVHHAAHSLKGLAANFSAVPTVQAAAVVEQLAKSGDGEKRLATAVPELQEALDELLAELTQHVSPAVPTDHSQRRQRAYRY
jgi:two-component system, sensor histidine kinase and response regulator